MDDLRSKIHAPVEDAQTPVGLVALLVLMISAILVALILVAHSAGVAL